MPKPSFSIFLLPHQDDEAGCFFEIEKKVILNKIVLIIYLTSGSLDKKTSLKRNSESINVLTNLGVEKKNIIFLSSVLDSPDSKLPKNLHSAFSKTLKILKKIPHFDSLYFLAWEGGHQDHDAAHLIGIALAKKFRIIKKTFQFPFYTGIGLKGSFFRLFKPIPSNGKPIFFNIPLRNRIKYARLSLTYSSQIKTWIGLFPFFLFHYIFFGTQILQPISLLRVRERPHDGKLLYERRFSYDYKFFKKKTSKFIDKYI
jgi:LmbE family N-acetylglucosaminyl deacetylase